MGLSQAPLPGQSQGEHNQGARRTISCRQLRWCGRQALYALLRIDPSVATLTAADVFPIPDDQQVCQYELTNDGRRIVNLTQDGKLRVYDIAPTWQQFATFDAVPAFDCAWDSTMPSPTVAVINNSAFVSDPENGRIREFHLNSLKQGLDIPVDGKPSAIAGGGNAG